MHDELYQSEQERRVLVEDRLFAFEEGVAYCTWVWTLAWCRDIVGVVVLVVVSGFGSAVLSFVCVVFLEPVAGAIVLSIPPSDGLKWYTITVEHDGLSLPARPVGKTAWVQRVW
jgi:hypothetical protein